jgi:ABC-type xylose transport system permease subunit
MDGSILWRAAVVQTLAVGVLFAALALALPKSFFEDWGAVVGPLGWIAASLVTMRVMKLALPRVAVASAVAGGLAAALGVAAAHAIALPAAIVAFAGICAARGVSATTHERLDGGP